MNTEKELEVMHTSEDLPRLLRIKEVMQIVRKKQSAIYGSIAAGTFPAPIKLGPRSVAWLEAEIRGWVLSRPRATQPKRG